MEVKACLQQRYFDVNEKLLRWDPPMTILCSRGYYLPVKIELPKETPNSVL